MMDCKGFCVEKKVFFQQILKDLIGKTTETPSKTPWTLKIINIITPNMKAPSKNPLNIKKMKEKSGFRANLKQISLMNNN